MSAPWWGELRLQTDETCAWTLGPVQVWIQRRHHEWRVATSRAAEAEAGAPDRRLGVEFPAEGPGVEVVRFGMAQTSPLLRVRPALAPLSVVCRPEPPFVLHPGMAVEGMVSTPLWMRLETEQVPVLHEVDLHRPSRTWFGPDTTQGELGYASRTKLRLSQEEFRHDPTRAATRIRVQHHGEEPLRIAQILVPVRSLSVGATAEGTLWTEDLRFGSTAGGLVDAQLGAMPPQVQRPLLCTPRSPPDGPLLHRAIAHFFG